ncbi:recombinase family protein [Kitasatospora sp. NPDC018619]|uniref:recombinase family protein n=1 Tax=unclassified Kitasatospora TaxID=2633591 RepID=UPI003794D590
MAGTNSNDLPLVDLLLRKSQEVRGVATRDILSIKAQERRGREWARENGYQVRRVWRENVSAYKRTVKRPDFDAAVHALLVGDTDALWVYDSSRYSRKGAGDVLKILDEPGKRLIFDYNGLDSAKRSDRKYIIQNAEEDREFSERLSAKLKSTKAEQREMGLWLGAAPYGTRVTKKRKLKNDKNWPIIERIHYEAADGKSIRQIAFGLARDGIPSPTGGLWSHGTISKILRHPVYLGWQAITVNSIAQVYLNSKGKKVKVFAKGAKTIPQEVWDRHRRIAAGVELPEGFGEPRKDEAKGDLHPMARFPTYCEGCGGRATLRGTALGCYLAVTGGECPAPVSMNRNSTFMEIKRQWEARLDANDPMDPTMLAVAKGWAALSQPEESNAEQKARGQVKLAEEAVARLDRLNAAGAYGGRDGEATFVKLRRAAVEDVEAARSDWEKIAKPTGDIGVLTDPERRAKLWETSTSGYQRSLLQLAIDKVYLKKAAYQGQRVTPDRIRIVWKTVELARDDEPAKPTKRKTTTPKAA